MNCRTCSFRVALSPLTLLVLAFLAPSAVRAQTPPQKLVVTVPMRDGTLLATDVYFPAGDGPWPVALARTPYGRTDFSSVFGNGIKPARFANLGIVLVVQAD